MKRTVFAVLGLFLLAGCGKKTDVRTYDNSLFELASGFNAKTICSCLYVMELDEDQCREWARVSPAIAKFKLDEETKTVKSRALGMGKTEARYVDEQTGCVIE